MARPKVNPLEKRSLSLSTAISERLKYQIELAARRQGVTVAAFVEMAVKNSLCQIKMSRPTGIPVSAQTGLWQSVEWEGNQKRFKNADVRNRLSEFIMEDAPSTSIYDEIILWDENPAIRMFLRMYLAPEFLTNIERAVWDAIKTRTVVESVRMIQGRKYEDWEQARIESYFVHHWDVIKQVAEGTQAISELPDEKIVKNENKAKPGSKKGKK
jgi:hypothetical protein